MTDLRTTTRWVEPRAAARTRGGIRRRFAGWHSAALSLVLALAGSCLPANSLEAGTVLTNLSYKTAERLTEYEKERCKLDLYLPGAGSGFATLVWFHGGALKNGIKDDGFNVRIALRLAQSGLAVAVPNYRLSPKATYPAYVEDAAAAFAWVRTHIAERGGNPHKVFVGGHSAGAYLTLMIGLDSRFLKPYGLEVTSIAGLIPVSGQTMTHYTVREERGLPKDTIIADEAAPVHYARKDVPPLLVLYGDKDLPARAEESQYLVAALGAAGHTRVIQKMIPDRDHGTVAEKIAQAGDPALDAILAFVRDTAAVDPGR